MKIFITGATGYIGGSLAEALLAAGHSVSGLARADASAAALKERGVTPVRGTLDDAAVLAAAARAADVTVNAANAGHRAAAEAMLEALAGTGKTFIHTSDPASSAPARAANWSRRCSTRTRRSRPRRRALARVEIDRLVRGAADKGVRSMVIAPSLIYGRGRGLNPHSIQVPWLIAGGEEIWRRQTYRSGREPLGERAYRRPGDGLSAGDRQGAGRRVLFRGERRERDARGVRGHQPHARLRRAHRKR